MDTFPIHRDAYLYRISASTLRISLYREISRYIGIHLQKSRDIYGCTDSIKICISMYWIHLCIHIYLEISLCISRNRHRDAYFYRITLRMHWRCLPIYLEISLYIFRNRDLSRCRVLQTTCA